MPTLLIVTALVFIVWIFASLAGRAFIKQMFWMGFLSVTLFLAFVLLNIDWVMIVADEAFFWVWIVALFIMTFCLAGIAAIAYEWIFHVKWKRPWHRHHHQVGLLLIGPAIMMLGLAVAPFAPLYFLLLGVAIDIIILLAIRPDLIIDGLFSGLFMGLLLSILFSFLFARVPGIAFGGWHLSGVAFWGVPLELVVFFFLFGMLWGPWYEVVKDYHPRRA